MNYEARLIDHCSELIDNYTIAQIIEVLDMLDFYGMEEALIELGWVQEDD